MHNLIEYLGYLASILILISMLMSSILKLRVVNLIGAALFSIYGYLIGSVPVAMLNFFVVLANGYYLFNMYQLRDKFSALAFNKDDEYFKRFYGFHKADIHKYFPSFEVEMENAVYSLFILKNTDIAGVFVASKHDDSTLKVELDYVLSAYRDLKPGKYLHLEQISSFKKDGYNKMVCKPEAKKHEKYLRNIGFRTEVKGGEEFLTYSF